MQIELARLLTLNQVTGSLLKYPEIVSHVLEAFTANIVIAQIVSDIHLSTQGPS